MQNASDVGRSWRMFFHGAARSASRCVCRLLCGLAGFGMRHPLVPGIVQCIPPAVVVCLAAPVSHLVWGKTRKLNTRICGTSHHARFVSERVGRVWRGCEGMKRIGAGTLCACCRSLCSGRLGDGGGRANNFAHQPGPITHLTRCAPPCLKHRVGRCFMMGAWLRIRCIALARLSCIHSDSFADFACVDALGSISRAVLL